MSEPQPRREHWTPNPDPSSIVVPGVDSTASVNAQIDQIDQLITIRLQNIDANFSRIQHVISTRLLPAFKRYAEGTEPVREAAKFWKSFYEAAAQVRIPISADTSSLYQTEDDSVDRDDETLESDQDSDRTPANINPQDDSFVRGAPVSSTPLVRDPTNVALPKDEDEDEDSWAASIESPFERLGRQVKNLTVEEVGQLPDDPSSSSALSFSPLHGSYTGTLSHRQDVHSSRINHNPENLAKSTPQIPQSHRKGKSPLRQNLLRQNAAMTATSDGMSTPPRALRTPHRAKTPRNPFLPPHSGSRQWNGLVDLRQPSPARSKATRPPRTPEPSGSAGGDYDSDSSGDLFPPGMSPPVTMQFAMASRAHGSAVKLGLTPARKAAERIGRDLVASAAGRGTSTAGRMLSPAKRAVGEPSLSSVAPSLPSLTRYSSHRASSRATAPTAASASLEPQPQHGDFMTPAHQIYRTYMGPEAYPQVAEVTLDQSTSQAGRSYSVPDPRRLLVDEGTMPSPGSSDSDRSEEHDESNPSAGFLFATQNNARASADDSFASSQQSMSSDEDEDDAARAARHPLAHIFAVGQSTGVEVEDSFDQDREESFAQGEEETVFGARQVGQGREGEARVRMLCDSLLDDTHPGAMNLNPLAQVEQTPTPYVREAGDFR